MTNRKQRKGIATETISILEAGGYATPSEVWHDLRRAMEPCIEGTRLHLEKETLHLTKPKDSHETEILLTNETTLACARRLALEQDSTLHLGALNFASAHCAGGGWQNGSLAQEESLAFCSGLYTSLQTNQARPYYEKHNSQSKKKLSRGSVKNYSSNMIFSPHVPVFRRDCDYELLEELYLCSFITSCAVNLRDAGDVAQSEKEKSKQIMKARALRVLQVAAYHGIDVLILGAWGCGVFKNEPTDVADAFRAALTKMKGRFRAVFFAVPGGKDDENYLAFLKYFRERADF